MYSSDFTGAADILRWQVVGDLLKLISWPIGFILIAQGRSFAFIVAEFAGNAAFLLALWLGLPRLGLEAAGVAYLAMFAFYLLVVIGLARGRTVLHLTRGSTAWIVGGLLSLGILALLVRLSPVLAMIACVAAVGVIAWISWGEIRQLFGRKATVHEGPPGSTASELA
jgi:PST family polysaccharide transporter